MISVIIPTYNRAPTLKIALEHLARQDGVEFEVIVVDDGSTDDTAEIVKKFDVRGARCEGIKYIYQKNAGQGTARNKGVQEASADIVLFIGDDIFVQPGFLKAHLETHQSHPEKNTVVLGYSTWNPPSEWGADWVRMGGGWFPVEVNDYMRFLERSGWQFGYGFLKPGLVENPQPYKFFYTSNISLKKSYFQKEKFDESFKAYGWEDMELGYRLFKNHDLKLFYQPDAKAYHHHHIPETELPKKMQRVGQSAVLFKQKHPDAWVIPTGLKKWLLKWATNPITLPLTRLLGKNTYFKFKSWREFWKGVGRQ